VSEPCGGARERAQDVRKAVYNVSIDGKGNGASESRRGKLCHAHTRVRKEKCGTEGPMKSKKSDESCAGLRKQTKKKKGEGGFPTSTNRKKFGGGGVYQESFWERKNWETAKGGEERGKPAVDGKEKEAIQVIF